MKNQKSALSLPALGTMWIRKKTGRMFIVERVNTEQQLPGTKIALKPADGGRKIQHGAAHFFRLYDKANVRNEPRDE